MVLNDSVRLMDHDVVARLGIRGVRTGVLMGDVFLFAVDGVFGTWIWPPGLGVEMDAPGGDETVGLLIGQAGTEISTWFHDAGVVAGQPTVIYSEI